MPSRTIGCNENYTFLNLKIAHPGIFEFGHTKIEEDKNKLEMCNSYLAELHLKIRAIPICLICFDKTTQNIAI